jgi:hypothetical protein
LFRLIRRHNPFLFDRALVYWLFLSLFFVIFLLSLLLAGPHIEELLDITLFFLLDYLDLFPYGVGSLFGFHQASTFLSGAIKDQKIFGFLFTVFQVAALLTIFGVGDVCFKIRLMIFNI